MKLEEQLKIEEEMRVKEAEEAIKRMEEKKAAMVGRGWCCMFSILHKK